MNNTKWKSTKSLGKPETVSIYDLLTHQTVCTMANSPEREVNTSLIEVAPELLAALQSIANLAAPRMSRAAEDGFRYHTAENDYRVQLASVFLTAVCTAQDALAKVEGEK